MLPSDADFFPLEVELHVDEDGGVVNASETVSETLHSPTPLASPPTFFSISSSEGPRSSSPFSPPAPELASANKVAEDFGSGLEGTRSPSEGDW